MSEEEEKEDLPKLDVPEKFEPFSNVSVDRKNEKYFRDFDDTE